MTLSKPTPVRTRPGLLNRLKRARAAVLFTLFMQFFGVNVFAQDCIDTDPVGDGWGWDGSASCRVNVTTNSDTSSDSCVDTDPIGDGWGWDGSASCRVDAVVNNDPETSPCIDTDPVGDGWGWDGSASCRVDTVVNNDPETGTCVDTDPVGDGWGWDGSASCRVDAVVISDPETGTCVDTDPVGDGWGWDGTASCRVDAVVNSDPETGICVDTDPVGDGWGWNGTASCQVDGGITGTVQYQPTGQYLREPGNAINVVRSLADFRANARDNNNGGFYTFVSNNGSAESDTRKSFVTQTRDAYTFSRAYMVTGDDRYLDHANHALDFLYTHGRDQTNGGWYFTANEQGALQPFFSNWDPNSFKWAFNQHYSLLGFVAMCEATRDSQSCQRMRSARSTLDNSMWDSNAGTLGYYERADADFSNPSGKSFGSIVDALTTHALQMQLIEPGSSNRSRVNALADLSLRWFVGSMSDPAVQFGFPDIFETDWSLSTDTEGSVGHLLKTAWVLARAYQLNPDNRYRDAARTLLLEVLDNGGWDNANGVPYTRLNWQTGEVETTLAEYWQIEQAVTGGLTNWYIATNQSDKDRFLKMADTALEFFARFVIDQNGGGTYLMNTPSGDVFDAGKGNAFKAEFHSAELFYYAYLYGSLMLKREPVTLYYKVPAAAGQQTLEFSPIEIDDPSLTIRSVRLDGTPITSFNADARTVTLQGSQGGELQITFGARL